MYIFFTFSSNYCDEDDIGACQEDMVYYKEWILSQNDASATLVDEMELACKYDYINRCSVVCDIILENGEYNILEHPFVKSDGTTMLHLASLSNSTAVGCHLVSLKGKDLVVRTIAHGLYKGATALHFACLNGNTQLVKAIIDSFTLEQCQKILQIKATGEFFTEQLNISGLPLTLAIWAGHKKPALHLLQNGGQLDMRY